MYIRAPRKGWRVRDLIADTERVNRSWPEWLNEERKQQAYARNRQIEKVIDDLRAEYGTTDIREIKTLATRAHYDSVQECRRVQRDRATYIKLECPSIIYKSSSSISREIDGLIHAPFVQFREAMKPHLEKIAEGRNLRRIY